MSLDAPHLKYAYELLEGDIPANPLTLLTCERAIDDHHNPKFDRGDWVFDYRYVKAFLRFCALVPHIKGEKALNNETFVLEPWQHFLIGEKYGWRDAENKRRMRFNELLLEIPKKNGKTSMSSLFALYELLYGEKGGEIFSIATKKDQAKIVWKMVQKMILVLRKDWQKRLSVTTSMIESDLAEFSALAKDSGTLDGPNPHRLLIDEAAAITNRDIIEKMQTAMGSRLSPMSIYTTTPQSDTNTVYYETREHFRYGLEGALSAEYIERMFGLIYAMEKDDDIYDQSIWLKANPNLGVSVREDYLQGRLDAIVSSPSKASNIRMLNFGYWESSTSKWINVLEWDNCIGEVLRPGRCYVGSDLALTKDLAVVARIWVLGEKRFHVDFQCFTNGEIFQVSAEELPRDLQAGERKRHTARAACQRHRHERDRRLHTSDVQEIRHIPHGIRSVQRE